MNIIRSYRNHRAAIVNGNDKPGLPDIEYEPPSAEIEIIGGEIITDKDYPEVSDA